MQCHNLPKHTNIPFLQVTACLSPPVATSALLTHHLCEPLHPDVASTTDWLCVVGTHGDLGNTLKWEPPFPDMKPTMKKYSKKTLNDVVSLINAPRRTATFDVKSAWDALCETAEPASVLKNPRLLAARAEVNAEVERVTHTAPKFSPDGKIAVFRIKSQAQGILTSSPLSTRADLANARTNSPPRYRHTLGRPPPKQSPRNRPRGERRLYRRQSALLLSHTPVCAESRPAGEYHRKSESLRTTTGSRNRR